MGITRHPLCSTATSQRLGDMPADEGLIRRLEDSFGQLSADGTAFADRFYSRLFQKHPGLRGMFPSDMAAQKRKLMDSLRMVIEGLRAPTLVRARLEELGRGHVKYGVKPEHYPLVCEMIVATLAEQPGGNWTAELLQDWSNAMRLISEIMLDGAKTAPEAP